MKVKETAKKPYGICPASMTIWNADQTYNKKGILGSYALRNNMFDVGAMLLIAVIGYFFLKLEIPIAPIVLALILGPLAESNLRRSLLLSQGSASTFFTRPICIFFLLLAVLSVILGIVMVVDPFGTMETLVMAIGIILIIEGAINLLSALYTVLAIRRFSKLHPETQSMLESLTGQDLNGDGVIAPDIAPADVEASAVELDHVDESAEVEQEED